MVPARLERPCHRERRRELRNEKLASVIKRSPETRERDDIRAFMRFPSRRRPSSVGCLDRLGCFRGTSNGHSKLDREADKNGRFLPQVQLWTGKLSSLRPPSGQMGRAICTATLVSREAQEDDQLHRGRENSWHRKANSDRFVCPLLRHETFLLGNRGEQWTASYDAFGRDRIVKVPLKISKRRDAIPVIFSFEILQTNSPFAR